MKRHRKCTLDVREAGNVKGTFKALKERRKRKATLKSKKVAPTVPDKVEIGTRSSPF